MKKFLFFLIAILLPGFCSVSFAQKTVLKSGSLDALKGMSELRVEYTYDNMMVGKMKEDDYIAKKVKEYNDKEPGKGDSWKEAWVDDRAGRYQPRFQDGFNNFCTITGVDFKIDPNSASKTRMVVHTTFTEPGFNIYMTSKNASINAEVTFFDESGAQIALVTITNSPGSGIWELDYDTGVRIQEAYANAGRDLAVLILEEVFGR